MESKYVRIALSEVEGSVIHMRLALNSFSILIDFIIDSKIRNRQL